MKVFELKSGWRDLGVKEMICALTASVVVGKAWAILLSPGHEMGLQSFENGWAKVVEWLLEAWKPGIENGSLGWNGRRWFWRLPTIVEGLLKVVARCRRSGWRWMSAGEAVAEWVGAKRTMNSNEALISTNFGHSNTHNSLSFFGLPGMINLSRSHIYSLSMPPVVWVHWVQVLEAEIEKFVASTSFSSWKWLTKILLSWNWEVTAPIRKKEAVWYSVKKHR